MSSLKRILIALLHSLNLCIFLLVALVLYGYFSGAVKIIERGEEIRTPISWSDVPIQNYIFNPYILSILLLLLIVFGSFYFLVKSYREKIPNKNKV